MTGPAWNGKGTDPWLPQRLDARIEVEQAEADIRRAVWAELGSWLTAVERRMIREGAPPDLTAVWALEPRWREAVEHLLNGSILKALRVVFARLLGRSYDFESRPAVNRYLTEVRNRLVRLPDEVYDLVAGQVAQGVNLGEGVPQLAARVDNVLSRTASERWPNRATVVARTETIGALNFARLESFRVIDEDTEHDEQLFKMWLATEDHRTRPTHQEADGQRVPMDQPFLVGGFELAFPGDPTGPPQEIIQCRCTMLLVDEDEEVDMSNRQMRR